MKAKKTVKSKNSKVKKQAAAPAKTSKAAPRELTRAEKTALAREAAATRRIAEAAKPAPAPERPTRGEKTAMAREAAAKRKAEKRSRLTPKPERPTRGEKTAMAREAAAKREAEKRSKSTPKPATPTRAQKTAAAREAAARRNAQKVTRANPAQPKETLTRAQKTAAAREASVRYNSAAFQQASETKRTASTNNGSKTTSRRPVSSKTHSKKVKQAESRQAVKRKTDAHTPKSRKEAKTRKKVSGSAKNIEIRPHSRGNHSFRVKKKKSGLGKLLLARLVLFFIIFSIMFSFVAGVFALNLKAGKMSGNKEYTLQLGEDLPEDPEIEVPEEDKPVYVEIPKSCAIRYGNLYIPVSALTDICELTVTGTIFDLRYLPRSSEGHSMRFIVDSDIAYVNGAKVRMISPSFIYEGKLYIPLDFIQKYSKGLAIEADDGNRKIKITKLLEGYDASTDSKLYSVLTFNLSVTSPLEPIAEPTE